MPDGLTAFLTERLDEAEAIARAAIQAGDGTWTQGTSMFDPSVTRAGDASISGDDLFIAKDGDNDIGLPHAAHIAANDPARTLRAIAAKRALIRIAYEHAAELDAKLGCRHSPARIEAGDCPWNRPGTLPVLRHLATEWDDHPAYRPEWSPEPAIAP